MQNSSYQTDYTVEEIDYPKSDVIISNFYLTVPSAHAASSMFGLAYVMSQPFFQIMMFLSRVII